MVFRMTIEYDGTAYYGWQVQPDVPTIQGAIEDALRRFLKARFRLVGASRTDRGVHARGQVASLHLDGEDDPARVRSALNGNLPQDIYIKELWIADENFNARKSATGKRYSYTLVVGRSPLLSRYAWEYVWGQLDTGLLTEMASELPGQRDMRNLSPGAEEECTLVRITNATWEKHDNILRFTIEGNRFLYRLVRNLVGLMVGIAGGRLDKEDFRRVLRGESARIITAPARGLCLEKVFYGDER
ncbi:MAG: tRNA pseudouridine(38-40) synthase TruA [candidate division WOR-3 bacterium]